ncbi:MAG: hypothetical protein OEU54_05790 [Gemmatimonadota bacterium]|nr:hypothetical protein [Gemmatimonadota bacterium]
MSSTCEPLRKKEKQELEGYVGWVPVAGRAALFVLAVGGVALFLRFAFGAASAANPALANPAWWIVPSVAVGAFLFKRARDWTGGKDLREKISQDLERGEAAVHTLHVLEGILIEEQEDEGPLVFVQTELSGVIRFAGQYLDREVRRGFPWPQITIREAPASRIFFGVRGTEGEVPLIERGPLTRMEAATLGPFDEEYLRLQSDFETLKKTLGLQKEG